MSEKAIEKQKDLILDVKNLNVRFETDDGIVRAVNGLDLEIERGHAIGLVGETGAGKTTTALALLRLVPDPPGVVECEKLELDGRDVLGMGIKELEKVRGKDISMIFQDPMTALNPVFTVGDKSPKAFFCMRMFLTWKRRSGRSPCWSLLASPVSARANTRTSSPAA